MQKHIPLRKCVGCGVSKPKCELVRIVKAPKITDQDEMIFIDITAKSDGRGTYICRNIKCLNLARKSKRLERAFGRSKAEEIFNDLLQVELKEDLQ